MDSAIHPLPDHPRRILILGGTSEARELARRLTARKDLTVISSLAGRVSQPGMPEGLVRIGGFGGVDGLTSYLVDETIDVVMDATHPFAVQISSNAQLACNAIGIPMIAFERPAWSAQEGDHWLPVPDAQRAALMANHKHNRVFLSIGRQELGAFSECNDAWFLMRSIEVPDGELPPNSRLILQRGPFKLNEERQLLYEESINLVISKNSGGTATYAKIEAARELHIPVVMIERPLKRKSPTLGRLDDVLARLAELLEPTSAGRFDFAEKEHL